MKSAKRSCMRRLVKAGTAICCVATTPAAWMMRSALSAGSKPYGRCVSGSMPSAPCWIAVRN